MIAQKKILLEKERVLSSCADCKGLGCGKCAGYTAYIDRMAEAEIPADYWFRDMKDFYGDPLFKDYIINHYINDLKKRYMEGLSLCLVGHTGTGKTMAGCSILKTAVLPSKSNPNYFSAYYTTLIEMSSRLMSQNSHQFRELIKEVDFMMIDEVDPRFFPSENSKDLHGNHFENVFRLRCQNRLPTIICSNAEDKDQIFAGEFRKTFNSLISQFGKVLAPKSMDARKGREKL